LTGAHSFTDDLRVRLGSEQRLRLVAACPTQRDSAGGRSHGTVAGIDGILKLGRPLRKSMINLLDILAAAG
jgi:hypothetical protein